MKTALLMIVFAVAQGSTSPLYGSNEVTVSPQLQKLENSAGGRLGVALVDKGGRLLAGQRVDERFAFCSTFKLLLGGMVLDGATKRKWSLHEQLPLAETDLVFHSPATREQVAAGQISVGEAASATVTVGDNTAANLLLNRVGGVEAFNAWLVQKGDRITRLDRLEPALNGNQLGDVRDTTTPTQIARSAAHLIFGNWLPAKEQATLRAWLTASQTGLKRIRAGLPPNIVAGDKTGTCGGRGRESYNDVAFVVPSEGSDRSYVLAVFLDRPKSSAEGAEGLIAQVSRSFVSTIEGDVKSRPRP